MLLFRKAVIPGFVLDDLHVPLLPGHCQPVLPNHHLPGEGGPADLRPVQPDGDGPVGPTRMLLTKPVIAAKLLGSEGVKLTIGDDAETAAAIESFGARHVACGVEHIVVDERLKVVSTPAYMLGPSIAPVAAGIDRLVSAVLEMI